jgi:hypothetical protein
VVGLITDDDETAFREEVSGLVVFQDNSLSLNVSKAKELIVDCRKTEGQATPPSTSTGL